MAFYTKLNSNEFIELLNNKSEKTSILNNFIIENIKFPQSNVDNITFADSVWKNIDAKNIVFENIKFKDCKISDSDFSGAKLYNVDFINCELHNVIFNHVQFNTLTFNKSTLINNGSNRINSYREMTGDKVYFNESTLSSINFFHSKMELYFNKSKLSDISSYGLLPNSSLSIINSEAILIEFSKSTLDKLVVKDSTITKSRINDAKINSIIIENNSFDSFPIASSKKYKTISVIDTSEITVHGTGPVTDVFISGCPSYKDIYISEMNFIDAKIENCKTPKLTAFDAVGKNLSLSNMEIFSLDLEDANIEHLTLNNVVIRGKIYAKNAKIKKYEAHNVTVLDKVVYKDEGANFKIISTK